MAMSIASNAPAATASRYLRNTTQLENKGIQKLASGLRIPNAQADASGLAISDKFESQVRQYDMESRNIQSGVNAAQTADGALQTQTDAVQRIRELAVQASNGTLSDENRAALNAEAQELVSQIDQTAQNTQFNGADLLATDQTMTLDSSGSIQLQTGASTAAALGLSTLDLSTASGAASALDQSDAARMSIDQNRSGLGAQQNRMISAIENRQTAAVDTAASQSAIRDLDYAQATMDRSRTQLLMRSGMNVLAQANVIPQNAMSLLGG